MMLYAKIVLGLPVEGPFDYIVPENLTEKIKAGSRVSVPFGRQKKIGYAVGLSRKTKIKNLKSIFQLLDDHPLMDKNMLLLTRKLSEYYCCSWGEAIELALPQSLRKGKIISFKPMPGPVKNGTKPRIILMHSPDAKQRWQDLYLNKIKETVENNKSVIILLSDLASVAKAEKIIKDNLHLAVTVLKRNRPEELKSWIEIKEGKANIVAGTRSSIFAPLSNLGLIIIDEEQAYGYKQDQSPHYHAREISAARADIEGAALILGSPAPTLESLFLARKNKIEYKLGGEKKVYPEVKVIDMKGLPLLSNRKNIILSKYLEDSIAGALDSKGKALLFLNRLGFATVAWCFNCGVALKCRRCNVNLVYHYKENTLSCRHCNFTIAPPKICPNCNSGYIRYSGAGTEKIESELSRLFPQAKVKRLDNQESISPLETGIFISTQAIIKEADLNFDLVGVLSIDNSLNHIDFRAAENTFDILTGLAGLTEKKLVIQTSLPQHYVFKALVNKDSDLFYNEELKQRKELKFPPYRHFAIIKLRGKKEEKAESASRALFDKLNTLKDKAVEVISVNPAYPSKLRGNFCWQILLRAKSAQKISGFIKTHLKKFSHSGIIVTVDIDPI